MGVLPSPLDAPPSATLHLPVPALDVASLPPAVARELRASHVGETVAVWIYRGALAATADPAVRRFAASHADVEALHLALFDRLMPPLLQSRPMAFWRGCGYAMGWLPARIGPGAFYAVVAAVERWVDGHYAGQIALVGRLAPDSALLALLEACRHDEAMHGEDAGRLAARPAAPERCLACLAVVLSKVGVMIARWL